MTRKLSPQKVAAVIRSVSADCTVSADVAALFRAIAAGTYPHDKRHAIQSLPVRKAEALSSLLVESKLVSPNGAAISVKGARDGIRAVKYARIAHRAERAALGLRTPEHLRADVCERRKLTEAPTTEARRLGLARAETSVRFAENLLARLTEFAPAAV